MQLAWLYLDQDKHEKAGTLFEGALNESQTLLGKSHPQSIVALTSFAQFHMQQGRNDEAEKLLVVGVRTAAGLDGPAEINLKAAVDQLADQYRATGDAEAAERCEKLLADLP